MEQITQLIQATEEERAQAFGENLDCFDVTEISNEDFEMDESTFGEPDTEGEIDENAVMPLCGSTGLSGAMYLGVNKSSSIVNIRNGASTSNSIIGKLYPSECFTFTGATKSDGSYTWYQVEFLNSSASWVAGWYRGTNGMAYWKNNPYSSVTSDDRLGGNGPCKTYRCNQSTKIWNGNKTMYATAPIGSLLLCKDGYQGKTGSSEHTWLLCHGIRYNPGGGINQKDELFVHIGLGSAGYADTNIKKASSNPTMRGNW